MLLVQKLMYATLFVSATLGACMTDHDSEPVDDTVSIRPTKELANNVGSVAQIKSASDLDAYLRITPNSPLDHMSAAAKQRFLDSLVFTKLGLASFQYSELETLSATETYQILSLFNVEHTAPTISHARTPNDSDQAAMIVRPNDDYSGYKCSPPATCVSQVGAICIASNCRTP